MGKVLLELILDDGQVLSLFQDGEQLYLDFLRTADTKHPQDTWVMTRSPEHFLNCVEELLAAGSSQSYWSLSQLGAHGDLTALDNKKVRFRFTSDALEEWRDVEMDRVMLAALAADIRVFFDK